MGESSEKELPAQGGLLTLNLNDDNTIQPVSTETLTSTSGVSLCPSCSQRTLWTVALPCPTMLQTDLSWPEGLEGILKQLPQGPSCLVGYWHRPSWVAGFGLPLTGSCFARRASLTSCRVNKPGVSRGFMEELGEIPCSICLPGQRLLRSPKTCLLV